MGLLKHPKNNRYRNKNLDNPTQINVENELSPNDIRISKNRKQRITEAVNIRVDNHIRNAIESLIQLGYAKNNKDLVNKLVQNKVSELDPEQANRFKYLEEILEEKDTLNYKVKHHK